MMGKYSHNLFSLFQLQNNDIKWNLLHYYTTHNIMLVFATFLKSNNPMMRREYLIRRCACTTKWRPKKKTWKISKSTNTFDITYFLIDCISYFHDFLFPYQFDTTRRSNIFLIYSIIDPSYPYILFQYNINYLSELFNICI